MIRSDKRLKICWLLIAVNLAFIWGNSLLPAEISQAFSDWVKEILSRFLSGGSSGGGGSGLLRKIAHFTEFATLGLCLGWLCGMLGKRKWLALLAGAAVGGLDELIQCFVPQRGPGILDVCIDTAGVAAGIGLLLTGYYFKQRIKQYKLSGGNPK